jgi:alpha-tubulin suppressor-like RCC1 family protein
MTGLRLGSWHGCAVQSGRVYCWGENDFGQAGVSGAGPGVIVPADAMRPVVGLPSGDPVVEVQPGRTSTCARTVAGEVWCWGRLVTLPRPMDSAGCEMLAAPDYACPPRLVRRPSGSWTRIGTTAAEAFCAIDDRGSVHCWGLSSLLPADPLGENDPRRMATLSDVASVTVGTNHACAVSAGEVYCWGANEVGQLGIGAADETIHLVPERVMW